jgi:hypothetical protein
LFCNKKNKPGTKAKYVRKQEKISGIMTISNYKSMPYGQNFIFETAKIAVE